MIKGRTERLYYIFPLIIFCIASTLVNAWIPITSRTWLLLLIGCFACVFSTPKYFSTRQFVWFLAYAFFVFLNYLSGDAYFNSFPKIVNELGAMVMMPAVTFLIFSKKVDKIARLILIVFSIALLITAIGTVLADIVHPGIVRELAEALYKQQIDASYLLLYYRWGLSNYLLPHALPIFVPALVYVLKHANNYSKIWRFLALFMLVASAVIVWLSGSTTALLFFLVFLFVALGTKTSKTKNNTGAIITILVLISPIILSKELQLGILNNLIDITGGSESTYKFTSHLSDLQSALLYEDTSGAVEARMGRYDETISRLFENILLGTNNEIGGHSATLDRLATLGLFGVIPLLGFLINHVNYVISNISREEKLIYIECVVAAIAMMSVKNMFNVEILLLFCTITPLLFCVKTI